MFDLVATFEEEAKRTTPNIPHAVISITSEDREVDFPPNPYRKALLRLRFHDEARPRNNYVTMSSLDAARVWSLVQKVQGEIDLLIIHCLAGFSRSPAIAAAIDEVLEVYDDNRWFTNYSPNRHVYRTMLNTFHFYDEAIEGLRKRGINLEEYGIAYPLFLK